MTKVTQDSQTGGNTVADKRVDFAYNAIGQFTTIVRYNDIAGGSTNEVATGTYTYDTMGRLTGLAYTKGGTNLFTAYGWTYDSLSSAGMGFGGGNGASDPRVAATASSAVYSAPGRVTQMTGQDGTSTYSYDITSQLTAATHTFQTNESYSYDDNGNRDMTGYQTGDDNQMTNDGTYSYTYDEEGNRTRRTNTSTSEVTDYEWDYRNRLTKVTEKNSSGTTTQVVEYIYDVFDRKIGKEVDTASPFDMADAVIERYVYDDIHNSLASLDGSNVVLDFVDSDGSGSSSIAMTNRYLHGDAVDQILAQEDVSKTLSDTQRNLWPLAGNLGTVRDLAKQDGTIAVHYKYDAYGNVTSGDTSKTRYLFTGREFDTDVDLQYNRARWYDPEAGRWISEDPIGFLAGDANLNRYVSNDPSNYYDPSGLYGFGDYIWGVGQVFKGYGNAAIGVVEGGAQIVFHPIETAKGLGHAVTHPIETATAIKDDIVEKSGTLEGQGQILGDVGIGILTGGSVKAIKETGRIGKLAVTIQKRIPGGPKKKLLPPACFVAGVPVVQHPRLPNLSSTQIVSATVEPSSNSSLLLACSMTAVVIASFDIEKRRKRKKRRNALGDTVASQECLDLHAGDEKSEQDHVGNALQCPSQNTPKRFLTSVDAELPAIPPKPSRSRSTWLVGWLSLAAIFALWGMYRFSPPAKLPVPLTTASATSTDSVTAIERIRVGDRVAGAYTSEELSGSTDINPATWRKLRLRAEWRWDDGTLDVTNVDTLQPLKWIVKHDAEVGNTVPLPLDLLDMGLPDDIRATVVSNKPCPPLQDGPGRVVQTTVNHLNNDVFELLVADGSGTVESIRTTGFHKFFRATDGVWISARNLAEGDRLDGPNGPVYVRSLTKFPGIHRVYNLTVEGEHVFRVSNLGVLVHNNGCAQAPKGGTYKLKDVDGNVKRTGRSKDLDARRRAHANNPETKDLDFDVDRRTDVYPEQRGREQMIHDAHPEALLENGGLNKIRGISPKNPRLEEYLEAGRQL